MLIYIVAFFVVAIAAASFYIGIRILLLPDSRVDDFVGCLGDFKDYLWGDNRIDGVQAVKGGAINEDGEIIVKSSHSKAEIVRIFEQ